jgi:DNA-binding CsgD family transcriptional regulator
VLEITPRECVLLQLLANGESTTDIAAGFDMSDGEVEAHLSALFARMGVRNRQEASIDAYRRGLLTRPPADLNETRRFSTASLSSDGGSRRYSGRRRPVAEAVERRAS